MGLLSTITTRSPSRIPILPSAERGIHFADDRRADRHGQADEINQRGDGERKHDVHERPGGGNNDFVQRRRGRNFLRRISLDGFLCRPHTRTVVRADLGFASASMDSAVIICGNFTKPPAGIQRSEYSMPSRFQLNIFGPKPMANSSTFMPSWRAVQKWPSSCRKMHAPNATRTAAIT